MRHTQTGGTPGAAWKLDDPMTFTLEFAKGEVISLLASIPTGVRMRVLEMIHPLCSKSLVSKYIALAAVIKAAENRKGSPIVNDTIEDPMNLDAHGDGESNG